MRKQPVTEATRLRAIDYLKGLQKAAIAKQSRKDDYDPREDIVSVLSEFPGLPRLELADFLGMSANCLSPWLLQMVNEGQIRKEDVFPARYYLPSQRSPKTPTSVILKELASGEKSIKYLRAKIPAYQRHLLPNALAQLVDKRKIIRIGDGLYRLPRKEDFCEFVDPMQGVPEILRKRPGCTFSELAVTLNLSDKACRKVLNALIEQEVIKRVSVPCSRWFHRFYLFDYPVEETPSLTAKVIEYLKSQEYATATIADIKTAIGVQGVSVNGICRDLVKRGVLVRVSRAVYQIKEG